MTEPLSLYLHVPFCTAKCGYCDFNSYANHEHLIPNYTQVLLHEAALWRRAAKDRQVATVFLGGGTPSLLPVDAVRELLAGLRETFEFQPGAEISLEANPGSLDEPYLRGLLDAGINRLSIGVQSLHDDELRFLDRQHSASDARAAFAAARAAGFTNVNLDFIFGLPEQPLERWQATLEEALAIRPEHLSLYALTVEEGTPLAAAIARGQTQPPDADAQADQYEWTQARLAAAGYDQYEISNWSLPGYRCRHNLTYWQCREYLGLGAGAHSFLNGVRFSTAKLPQAYTSLVEESWASAQTGDDTPMRQVVSGETITTELAMSDTLTLGLRLTEGVDRDRFRGRFGIDPFDVFGDPLQASIEQGLLELDDRFMRLTDRGRLLANEVLSKLLPD